MQQTCRLTKAEIIDPDLDFDVLYEAKSRLTLAGVGVRLDLCGSCRDRLEDQIRALKRVVRAEREST